MSEWVSVLAVFWLLWAIDGVRLAPRRIFSFVGVRRCDRAQIRYSRLSLPAVSPLAWRVVTADVPLSLSPAGVCNQPAGAAGRPAENPARLQSWRWEEIREVAVAKGWIFVNGERFCPDTGHLTAPQFLALARLAPAAREAAIRKRITGWFRIAQLRRRRRVLAGRSALPATCNAIAVALFAALTVYVVADFPSRLPTHWSERFAEALPAVLIALLVLHGVAVVSAFRTVRRLRAVTTEKRGANLFSALLLPPQALRLRGLLADGFFPAQHPLAVALAFAGPKPRAECAFDVLADLRWPLPNDTGADTPLSREILAWFRSALEREITPRLASAGLSVELLLRPPAQDAPASCSYCPRCRDQFVAGPRLCPHGVPLQPLPVASKAGSKR